MVNLFGITGRIGRVLLEALILVFYVLPIYEEFRQSQPQLKLPKADSFTGVFIVTLLADYMIFSK